MLVFTVRLSSMGNQYAQQWKGIAFLTEVFAQRRQASRFYYLFLAAKGEFLLTGEHYGRMGTPHQ